MIKDILVNLSLDDAADRGSRYAVSLASALNSHLAGVAYRYEIEAPGVIFDAGVVPQLIAAQRAESEGRAKDACRRFGEATRLAGVASDCRNLETTIAGAGEHFGRTARVFDLAVVSQPSPGQYMPEGLLIEGALFQSGHPVVVVPYIQSGGVRFNHITVCWDGSRAAARAVSDAMPILRMSKKIELLMVENKERSRKELPGVDMAEHLARHSLQVELNSAFAANIDVGNAILSHVSDTGSDFLVMGGYGHSRLRELVLGGVTKSMLTEMTLPVLMSH